LQLVRCQRHFFGIYHVIEAMARANHAPSGLSLTITCGCADLVVRPRNSRDALRATPVCAEGGPRVSARAHAGSCRRRKPLRRSGPAPRPIFVARQAAAYCNGEASWECLST
jgi:hypothetical protein